MEDLPSVSIHCAIFCAKVHILVRGHCCRPFWSGSISSWLGCCWGSMPRVFTLQEIGSPWVSACLRDFTCRERFLCSLELPWKTRQITIDVFNKRTTISALSSCPEQCGGPFTHLRSLISFTRDRSIWR